VTNVPKSCRVSGWIFVFTPHRGTIGAPTLSIGADILAADCILSTDIDLEATLTSLLSRPTLCVMAVEAICGVRPPDELQLHHLRLRRLLASAHVKASFAALPERV